MHSELEQLLILQDREQKIRQIRTEIETIPLRRTSLEAQLAASRGSVEALKQRARHVEMDRKKLELDVGTRTETVSRLKTQQYQTRKNDEFQAIGHEIDRYENEIRKIEDDELELMVLADKIKADLAEEEKKAAAAQESIARQTADLDEKSKALESQFEALTRERSELAEKIDEDLLGRFERLFKSKGDAAVVAIEHGVCTGCHMKVTTATASQVRAGKEMVSCENCGRILYFGE
ncbi:MAG TPA: C4-type zinc ribbon domain-containing protein [Candidatus Limnocylindria bacterium]|nr:C4-type zinc ribbon domain-containing protein [Candidatus Limnocylindria bacterium]